MFNYCVQFLSLFSFVCFLMCNAARKLTLGTRVLSAKRWSSIFHLQKLITETGRNEDVMKWGEKAALSFTIC